MSIDRALTVARGPGAQASAWARAAAAPFEQQRGTRHGRRGRGHRGGAGGGAGSRVQGAGAQRPPATAALAGRHQRPQPAEAQQPVGRVVVQDDRREGGGHGRGVQVGGQSARRALRQQRLQPGRLQAAGGSRAAASAAGLQGERTKAGRRLRPHRACPAPSSDQLPRRVVLENTIRAAGERVR